MATAHFKIRGIALFSCRFDTRGGWREVKLGVVYAEAAEVARRVFGGGACGCHALAKSAKAVLLNL